MGYKNDLIHLKGYVFCSCHTTILLHSLLTCLTASDEIRVLAFDIHLVCSEYGFKHNLLLIKKCVCLSFSYGLFVLNMNCRCDSRIEMN